MEWRLRRACSKDLTNTRRHSMMTTAETREPGGSSGNCAHERGAARRAFTRVELLVVLAVAGLLVAIAIPGLARTAEPSRQMVCENHLRVLALGFMNLQDGTASVVDHGVGPRSRGFIGRFWWSKEWWTTTNLTNHTNGDFAIREIRVIRGSSLSSGRSRDFDRGSGCGDHEAEVLSGGFGGVRNGGEPRILRITRMGFLLFVKFV